MKSPQRHDRKTTRKKITAADLSLDEKIAQMAQIDINWIVRDDGNGGKELNPDGVEEWIGRKGVGSVLNLVSGGYWTAQQYRQAVIDVQQIAREYNRTPVIWGIDSVHGANYFHGAVVSPQPINLAATWNTTAAWQAGKLGSRDTRAGGIPWLFSPLLGLSLEPLWSRVYETFGEDPHLVGAMAAAMIVGIQEETGVGKPSKAAACGKHFVGYSQPHNGHDRSPSSIPTRHLYQYFVPPWITAISEAKVKTVMESYVEYDGVPNVANPHALQYLLRQRLGFEGMLVTDYMEMKNLAVWHHVAKDYQQAVQQTLRRGSVDMNMVPDSYDDFMAGIKDGLASQILSEDRIDESVNRILRLKADLGLFDEEITIQDDNLPLVGRDETQVYETVLQSIILTKNEGRTLPLLPHTSKDGTGQRLKVLVTGPTAASRIYPTGGWTAEWQGVPLEDADRWFTYGEPLVQAFTNEASLDVSYRCGVDILGKPCDDEEKTGQTSLWEQAKDQVKDWTGIGSSIQSDSIRRAVELAPSAEVVFVALGEEPYAEKPADIRSLNLPSGQYDLVKQIRENAPDVKIVLVYFGGRPRLLRQVVDLVDAVFVGFLPGPSAGQAVVDLALGRANPSGKLPLTYPLYEDGGGTPYFHTVSDECTKGDGLLPHWDYVPCQVQWPFGHGLTYTSFTYADFQASGGIDRDLELSVVVKNTGGRAGAETVMFFTFDDFRPTTPEFKMLRAFEKVHLEVGEEVVVSKTVPLDQLRFVGPDDDTHYIIEPTMTSWVGVGPETNCREASNQDSDACIPLSSSDPDVNYVSACEAACNLWMESACDLVFDLSQERCIGMCTDIASVPSSSMDRQHQGWGWNYVRCLESVVYGMGTDTSRCQNMVSLCRDIFNTGRMNEYGEGSGSIEPFNAPIPEANYIALIIGLVASFFVLMMMKGATYRPRHRGPEFTSVNTVELQ